MKLLKISFLLIALAIARDIYCADSANLLQGLIEVLRDKNIQLLVKKDMFALIVPQLNKEDQDAIRGDAITAQVVKNRTEFAEKIKELVPQTTDVYKQKFIETIQKNAGEIADNFKGQPAGLGGPAVSSDDRKAMAAALEQVANKFKS